MKLEKIFVKAVKGRLARNGPRGRTIPEDSGVLVTLTPYIERLLNVHKDIVETTDPENPIPRSKKPRPGKVPDADAPADPPPPPVATETTE